ncbi:MAG: sodium:solute symporter family protein [Candidatus Adiutrix sp.]|jgi:SSS family solute:Na+ symporter|nr:sodium:solute symporter family protein [Candidatus Adiutrix sp.]
MSINIPLLIVIIYIIMLYAISWYSTKLSKGGAIGFLLANRGLPAIIIAVMIAGLAIGGASTVGVSESSYTKGLSAGMYNAAWAAGAIVVGIVAAKRLRNMNLSTIPELFGKFYTPSARYLGVIGQLVIMLTILALQYVAGGAVLTALLPEYFNFTSGMSVTAVVFVGICLIGGYWAAGLSNFINVIVIYLGLVIGCVSVVSSAGGLGALSAALPEAHWFSFVEGIGFPVVAGWFVVMITQTFGVQAAVQTSFAAKDSKSARNGFIIGGLIILPVGFIAALIGMGAAVKYPGLERAALALPTIMMDQNPVVSGLTLAGLWAADVSTAVGLLLGCATMIMQDVIAPLRRGRKTWDNKKEMFMSRVMVLIVAAVTFLMALQVRSILGTIMIGLSLTTAYTMILLASLFFPQWCRRSSAIWCLIVGLGVILIWQFVPSLRFGPQVIYIAWPAVLITFFLVAVLDKNKSPIPENWARDRIEESTDLR